MGCMELLESKNRLGTLEKFQTALFSGFGPAFFHDRAKEFTNLTWEVLHGGRDIRWGTRNFPKNFRQSPPLELVLNLHGQEVIRSQLDERPCMPGLACGSVSLVF